jgi:hypothetical protein
LPWFWYMDVEGDSLSSNYIKECEWMKDWLICNTKDVSRSPGELAESKRSIWTSNGGKHPCSVWDEIDNSIPQSSSRR